MASLVKRKFKNAHVWYIQYYRGSKQQRRRASDNYQLAKEKLRQFESAEARGELQPLPTKTPVAEVLTAYVAHIRATKTPKSAQTDVYYLREMFGPICDALRITSRRTGPAVKKRPPKPGQDRRYKAAVLEPTSFETLNTADIARFIAARRQSRGLAAKTANRYREILTRLVNWAMSQHGIRMPGDRNPAAAVQRYAERAPEIRFLSLEQIQRQLAALADRRQLQTMVAMLIYAGLRREEMTWLTHEDIDLSAGAFGMLRIRAKTINGRNWQPKTKINRVVPISSALRRYLDAYQPRIVPDGWYFPSPDGKWWDPDNFSHDLRDANQDAGLPWTCLDYRHTFGSQLAMKGESLYKIATLMGNSPEICRRHYAAMLPEALVESVEFPSAQPPRLALPA